MQVAHHSGDYLAKKIFVARFLLFGHLLLVRVCDRIYLLTQIKFICCKYRRHEVFKVELSDLCASRNGNH